MNIIGLYLLALGVFLTVSCTNKEWPIRMALSFNFLQMHLSSECSEAIHIAIYWREFFIAQWHCFPNPFTDSRLYIKESPLCHLVNETISVNEALCQGKRGPELKISKIVHLQLAKINFIRDYIN